jgi:hypothetical protein
MFGEVHMQGINTHIRNKRAGNKGKIKEEVE